MRGRLSEGLYGAKGAIGIFDWLVYFEPCTDNADDLRREYRLRHAGMHATAQGQEHRGEPVREDGRLSHVRSRAEQEILVAQAGMGFGVVGEGWYGVWSYEIGRRCRSYNAGGYRAHLLDNIEYDIGKG